MTTASRPPVERDEVVVVAARPRSRSGSPRRARSPRRAGTSRGKRLCWISRAICSSRSCRSFSSRIAVEPRALERGLSLARQRRGEVEVLLAKGRPAGLSPTARSPLALPVAASGTTSAKRAAASASRDGPSGSAPTGVGPSGRAQAGRPAAASAAPRSARRPRACERPQRAVGVVPVEGAARREELAHHGRGHEPLDRRPRRGSPVSSRPMSKRLWSWKTFTESDRLTCRSSS